jgi:hypothetical protein
MKRRKIGPATKMVAVLEGFRSESFDGLIYSSQGSPEKLRRGWSFRPQNLILSCKRLQFATILEEFDLNLLTIY